MRPQRQAAMRALVIGVNMGDPDYAAHADEFLLLARSAGARVVDHITAWRDRPDPALFIGSGKVAEIAERVEQHKPNIILFDQPLGPAQQRNLERALKR